MFNTLPLIADYRWPLNAEEENYAPFLVNCFECCPLERILGCNLRLVRRFNRRSSIESLKWSSPFSFLDTRDTRAH